MMAILKKYLKMMVAVGCVVGLLVMIPKSSRIVKEDVFEIKFEKELFDKGLEGFDSRVVSEPMVAGVVPHHLLPGEMIADFFFRISQQNPKTIILIGPNHYEAGEGNFLSSDKGFKTEFGVVEVDLKLLNMLLDQGVVAVDNEMMEDEHAVTGLVTFMKYFLPEVRIVPIAISNFTPKEKIDQFVDVLRRTADGDVVVVGSLDFSHYLNVAEAEIKDEVTLRALKRRDTDLVLGFNNDYVDSPVVLAMMMGYAGDRELMVFGHNNSGRILGNEWVETTSYFTLGWKK